MIVTIYPSKLSGTVKAPPSKSSMQRACAAALLTKGKTILHNPGNSNDDLAAIEIIEALGALVEDHNSPWLEEIEVEINEGDIYIDSEDYFVSNYREINCRESGLSIRMFTPIIALSDKKLTIKGEGSLKKRPMDFFDKILPQLGVKIKSNDGKLPMVIQGPLRPMSIEVDGSLSSQFITGLLMAYSAADAKDVSIKVNNLKSKPYVSLTLDVMERFGMKLPENRNYEEFYFSNNIHDSRLTTHDYTVEGDWSGAAFLLIAGAIAGPVTITGLDLTSRQADKAIINVLTQANAGIAMDTKGIKVHPSPMNAFEFDATDCPDLFPPLVALASYCKGRSVIKGVSRLIHKESNRAQSLEQEFAKMGVRIDSKGDEMMIEGVEKINGATIHSHGDHRIAMACVVAGLKASGETTIQAANAVKKSYPGFFNDLKSLGATLSLPINGLTNQ